MFSFKAFQQLDETVYNPGFNPDDEHKRNQYRDEIHDILHKSYAKIKGGYGGAGSGTKEESENIHHDITHSHMKINTHNGKVKAVLLYKHDKKKNTRKLIAGGTDHTIDGLKRYAHMAGEDFGREAHKRHTYVEMPHHEDPKHPANTKGVAGLVKKVAGHNLKYASQAKAAELTGKKIEPTGDGHSYTRKIGNMNARKIIATGSARVAG